MDWLIQFHQQFKLLQETLPDVENPQLVAEYINEMYAYMCYLEDKQSISEEYLSHVKSTIMPKWYSWISSSRSINSSTYSKKPFTLPWL